MDELKSAKYFVEASPYHVMMKSYIRDALLLYTIFSFFKKNSGALLNFGLMHKCS